MTHDHATITEGPMESPSRLKRLARVILLAVRAPHVRLRFILILAGAFAVVGRWDTLRNHVDRWMSELVGGGDASRAAPPNSEYFCPTDPAVIRIWPGKCGICNRTLMRRTVGDAAPLPPGAPARMPLYPYRIQHAGIQTAPVGYRPAAREITVTGIVRDEGLIRCRVLESDRPFVVAGQAAEVTVDDGARQPAAKGKVIALKVDPRESRTNAEIRLDEPGRAPRPGTRVLATVRRPVAELEPFRSLPSELPPLVEGELLAVYACPRHAEALASDRGRCPVDRNEELQRRPLLANQRVRWWCPTHPNVTTEKAGASCQACGGMKLIPRIITYRPPGEVLTVPESAVVDTGNRAVVFVEGMPGLFDGVEIVAGPRCGDVYPVASGLEPGQRVAIRGALLLDAGSR